MVLLGIFDIQLKETHWIRNSLSLGVSSFQAMSKIGRRTELVYIMEFIARRIVDLT